MTCDEEHDISNERIYIDRCDSRVSDEQAIATIRKDNGNHTHQTSIPNLFMTNERAIEKSPGNSFITTTGQKS